MTVALDAFKRGMDVTRPAYAANPDTLALLVNGHLTRGGDVEQRMAFADTHAVAGTFGLAQVKGRLCVFGNTEARPANLPIELAYQGLPHPADDGPSLSGVSHWTMFSDRLYVIAQYEDGSYLHWYDGEVIAEWVDGRARGGFYIVTGAAGADNKILEVLVDGMDVLGGEVPWANSHADTAAAVAAQINAEGLFGAEAVGQQVHLIAPDTSADWNDKTIGVTVGGNVAASLVSKLNGGGGTGFVAGPACLTFGDKVYSVSGKRLHFSELFDPTVVQPNADGAGFADLSTTAEGGEDLVALAPYYSVLAVLGRNAVHVWSVDVDDANNERLQTLPEEGALGARAVQTWRDGSLLFLSRRGVKALTARDSSGRGAIVDFSLPVDTHLISYMDTLTDAQRGAALLFIEPKDGRLWCVIGARIYVYSMFDNGAVSGWSYYEPGLSFTDAVVADHRLWLRAGDTLYLYGGASGAELDADTLRVRLQFMGGGGVAPTRTKEVRGIDLGLEGVWAVYLLPDFQAVTTRELLAVLDGPTFGHPWHPALGWASHFALELEHSSAEEKGVLTSIYFHVDVDASR